MSVLDKAKNHYQTILSGGLQSIEVPEWETTIYFKPVTNFTVEQKIIELHSKGKTVEALVESLIQRALDADGKRLFTTADKVTLMREVDPNVIVSIVTKMNEVSAAAKESMGN